MLKNINLLKIFNYINNEYCIVYVHYMKHVTSILANTILANTTAKFAQVAAGLLSACCGMSSTGHACHMRSRGMLRPVVTWLLQTVVRSAANCCDECKEVCIDSILSVIITYNIAKTIVSFDTELQQRCWKQTRCILLWQNRGNAVVDRIVASCSEQVVTALWITDLPHAAICNFLFTRITHY